MRTGGCLCGAVRYEADGDFTQVTYCHCTRCRRWHGHAGAYTAVDRSGFRLTEQRGLRWFSVAPRFSRGFCNGCGSSVLFDDREDPKISICAGTLDAPTGLTSSAHIYVRSKGDYYELCDDGLRRFDEAP